ncbi:Type IV fimbrial assembly, ATPase PilB [hydrothermal vent metagenome]|uniref:Type IV fimbrial assembly, ATPase PilB n=1 Tax=hydrothermal vent metagenome TaxID=652676 RepID=A0A3B0VK64_9ZZZZ
MNILDVLIQQGFVKTEDRALIEKEARIPGVSIEQALVKYGIPIETTLSTVANYFNLPYRILNDTQVPSSVLKYIPEDSARHYHFVPIAVVDGSLEVGITNPDDIEALDALQFISTKIGMPYQLFLISSMDFKKVLDLYQNLTGEIGEALSEFESETESNASVAKDVLNANASARAKNKAKNGKEDIKADAPVTKIVATILRYAVEGDASDVHIEPSPEKLRVRFRMDGELHTSLELPAKVHSALIARIKILSQMRLDEKRKPQDGRFSANVSGRRIDFRVSTFPTNYGEKVVMRILDQAKSKETLESLGLEGDKLEIVRQAVRHPYGIVLITGPTGSGKSTTLFAILSELDRETKNVVSLEDPVEYNIQGVSQSQVRPEIGYTFASGLRSILRQDPDIIMVGEIRDKETAQLAVQSALTGHLVLSTLHTNTAADAIPRLIDMGVDPYLIAPTLLAVIGQRLVRILCPDAGKPFPISDSLRALLEKEFVDVPAEFRKNIPTFEHFYHASSTTTCPNGTSGRTGAFEVMRMDKELEHIVLTNPIVEEIYTSARGKGMFTMREDAIIKALAGKIPFEEVNTLGGSVFPEDKEDN